MKTFRKIQMLGLFTQVVAGVLLTQSAAVASPVNVNGCAPNSYLAAGLISARNVVIPKSTSHAASLCQASENATSNAASSIIRLAQDVLVLSTDVSVVKIPNSSYDSILAELQSKNVKILDNGAQRPSQAKVMFQLKSESGDRAQTLYLD